MLEIRGNIWDYWDSGANILVTTNGTVTSNKCAVMGRGIALQASRKFPHLKSRLGQQLLHYGNHVFRFYDLKIVTFPVKYNWYEKADLDLIDRSARELKTLFPEGSSGLDPIYLVRPGCMNGKLDWEDVKPVLEKYLNNNFIIVERNL